MQNRKFYLSVCLFLYASCAFSSDIQVKDIEWLRDAGAGQNKIRFTLSWNNSWRNDRNHDAAWVFIKYVTPAGYIGNIHGKILPTGHQLISNQVAGCPAPVLEIPKDSLGFFIYPAEKYRGNIQWTITVALDAGILNQILSQNWLADITAIEMVHIPEGAFTVGEADTAAARKNFALFSSDGNGKQGSLYRIRSGNSIKVSTGLGDLYYNSQVPLYNGDQKGIIPAEFPKGFRAFYIMKYETTQGMYAEFLNSISGMAVTARENLGGKDYYLYRGSIYFENGKYVARSNSRPHNYFSWDDASAYADWSGLRPITELEFEKASRGSLPALPNEYPWNTSSKEKLQREVSKTTDDLVFTNGAKESDLNDTNREQFGASYYWVMDLAGSLWERCVTIGDSTGRSFTGSHGDGILNTYGFATNKDWPKGSTETAGFGFKGGGYYEHNKQYPPGHFNPYSPIGNRNYGSWPGGARSIAYGSRFGRTVLPGTIIRL